MIGLTLEWARWLKAIPRWSGRASFDHLAPPQGGITVFDAGSEPGPIMLTALDLSDILLIADDGSRPDWMPGVIECLAQDDRERHQSAAALGETYSPLHWADIVRLPIGAAPRLAGDMPPLDFDVFPKTGTFWDISPASMPRADYVLLRDGPEKVWSAFETLMMKTARGSLT